MGKRLGININIIIIINNNYNNIKGFFKDFAQDGKITDEGTKRKLNQTELTKAKKDVYNTTYKNYGRGKTLELREENIYTHKSLDQFEG